jgi:hypothetical protein
VRRIEPRSLRPDSLATVTRPRRPAGGRTVGVACATSTTIVAVRAPAVTVARPPRELPGLSRS